MMRPSSLYYRIGSCLTAVCLAAFFSCADLRKLSEEGAAASQKIEATYGVKAAVSIAVLSGTKAKRKSVRIRLSPTPRGEIAKVKADIERLVHETIPDATDVLVTF